MDAMNKGCKVYMTYVQARAASVTPGKLATGQAALQAANYLKHNPYYKSTFKPCLFTRVLQSRGDLCSQPHPITHKPVAEWCSVSNVQIVQYEQGLKYNKEHAIGTL